MKKTLAAMIVLILGLAAGDSYSHEDSFDDDGRVTFSRPGDFYLLLPTDPDSGLEQPRAAVGYLDVFQLLP